MNNWYRTSLYTLLGGVLPIFATAALADEEDTQEQGNIFSLSLQELLTVKVAIASAFSESLLQASSSVSVTTREQWQRQGDQQITDVLSHLPSILSYSTLGSNTIAIRGFAHSTSVRGVATVLDGVPLNSFAFGSAFYDKINFDLNALNKIEVIRGPSSAIYGSDSFHGVVSLQGYQAKRDETQLKLQTGDDGRYGASLRLSQALGNQHRMDMVLAGSQQPDIKLDYNYTEPVSAADRRSQYAYEQQQQTAVLRFRSQNDLPLFYDAGLYLNRYKSEAFPGVGTQFFSGVSQLQDRDWVDADSGFDMVKFNVGKHFNSGITASLLSYYMQSDLEHSSDFTRPFSYTQLTRDKEKKQGLALKLKQLYVPLDTEWSLSFSYDDATISKKTTTKIDENGQTLAFSYDDSDGRGRISQALALQAKTRLFDERLILLYGGRWDDFSDLGNQLTPRAGIIYLPSQNSALKLLYGQAFRAPTALELSGIGVAAGNNSLKPEVIDTLELIFMIEGNNWRTEWVAFYSDWSNGIVIGECKAENACDESMYSGQYTNIAENHSNGIEFIFASDWKGWFSRNSLSYVHSENKNTGIEYSAFPQWIFNIDMGKNIDTINTEFYITNRLYLGAKDGPELLDNRADKLAPYWRTDLHLGKAINDNSQLYLDIKNLLAQDNFKPALWNNENGLEDVPRTFILGMNYRF